MARARSHRLFPPTVLGGDPPQLVYTVPVGAVVIVKSVRAVNGTGEAATLKLRVDAGDGQRDLWPAAASIPGNSLANDAGWNVLEPGDELYASCTPGGALTLHVSGAILSA